MTNLVVHPPNVVSDNDPVGFHLGDRGSDRGSGYWKTNTILRHCDKLFATWQSYDPNANKYDVWVGTNQLGTSIWLNRVKLLIPSGYNAMDDHGGASIIADSSGFLHLFYGPHHAPMLEAISTNPWDASAFASPQIIPTAPWLKTTYSSVVLDNVGTLHFLYRGRSSNDEWRMIYQRGATNITGMTTWQQPLVLASTANGNSDTTGYSLYHETIAVGRKHILHVAYQLYKQTIGAARSWGYLRSNNGGATWQDANGLVVSLPIDNSPVNSSHLVESSTMMDVRVCNIAVDLNGDPWISVLYLAHPSKPKLGGYDTKLWHLNAGKWSVISLSPFISSFGSSWRVAGATITFDAQGVLYVAAERVDMNDPTPDSWWAGKSKEVIVLMSTDMGQTFQVYPVSPVDPARPHWLANIERPTTTAPIPVPSLLYTDGPLNPTLVNQTTDIVFVSFYKY